MTEAMAQTALHTLQYTKRQRTFFRHQLAELEPIPALGDTLEDTAVFA